MINIIKVIGQINENRKVKVCYSCGSILYYSDEDIEQVESVYGEDCTDNIISCPVCGTTILLHTLWCDDWKHSDR